MALDEIIQDIHGLDAELKKLEQRYGMGIRLSANWRLTYSSSPSGERS